MVTKSFFWDPLEDSVIKIVGDAGQISMPNTIPDVFGEIISIEVSGAATYLHSDALGSLLAATDSIQTVTGHWSYEAFGEGTEETGQRPSDNLGYIGKRGYEQSLLIEDRFFVRFRILISTLARWASSDPLLTYSLSPYAYALSQPTRSIDPSGLLSMEDDEPPKLSDDEKKALLGCECGIRKGSDDFGEGIVAFVACRNGKSSIYINKFKDNREKTWPTYQECGFDKCVLIHEDTHIRHHNHVCPTICPPTKPSGCGDPADVPEVILIPYLSPKRCHSASECFAYLNELKCLKMLLDSYLALSDSDLRLKTVCIQAFFKMFDNTIKVEIKKHGCEWTGDDGKLLEAFSIGRERLVSKGIKLDEMR